jgi:DNA-directed RNA polymerase subunit RPC12/RpoP
MIEAERYRKAWQAYRRRIWMYLALLAACGALLGLVPTVELQIVCVCGMVVATAWFNNFRCPRCNEGFQEWPKLLDFGTGRRCDHCGLKLYEIPGETTP